MNPKDIKQQNNMTNDNKDSKQYNMNMEILSSIKDIPCKTIPLSSNEIVKNNNISKINLVHSQENESIFSQKNTCSTTMIKDSLPNINNINYPFPNYFPNNSIFKRNINISPFLNPINYVQNFSPFYQFYLNSPNFYSPIFYNFNYTNNNYINNNELIPLEYNNNQFTTEIIENSDKFTFLNKKRNSDNKFPLTIKESENSLKINKNLQKNIETNKKEKKYGCKHFGCDITFKTEKLSTFHHLKMSPECQDDSIYLLKLIYETKKLLLKIIKGKRKSLDRFSSLYENTMKEISLVEHIKIYTGLHFNEII